jgi:sigma-B regulation protein RsbU (phosphoserine phosphatase)
VADVSGKGVSSALLASLLQGAFMTVSDGAPSMKDKMRRINTFLNERTEGGKYATVFFAMLGRDGQMLYINAGHCTPLVVPIEGPLQYLETTSVPVGLMDVPDFPVANTQLLPGAKVLIYSDGVTEAQSPSGEFFGRKRLRDVVQANTAASCEHLHELVQDAVTAFTSSAAQSDDLTMLVIEYQPG